MQTVTRRPRGRVLVLGLLVLPAWLRQLALRSLAALLWLPVWICALLIGHPPRWWRRFDWWLVRLGVVTRAGAWNLSDRAPWGGGELMAPHRMPDARMSRRSLLGRLLGGWWYLLLRYLVGVFAAALAFGSWCYVLVRGRNPRRLQAAQWTLQSYVTDVDCWLLLVSPVRPKLPEPDPRLRAGVPVTGDHGPLPPWRRRTGFIGIAVDLTAGVLLSSTFLAVGGDDAASIIGLVFVADLAIQFMQPYLGIYLSSQDGPIQVSYFGYQKLRPLRSLGWAVGLIAAYALVLISLVILIAPFAADSGGGIVPDGASTGWTIAFVGIGTVMAPCFEEFFYRGYMFQALRQGRGTWGAAAISSIAFAAAHLEFSPVALADRALIGVGLCFLFAKTGRLLPGMFAHSINNSIVIPLVIGWTWQIALVLPISLLVILLVATAVGHLRGEWAPV